VQGREEPPFEGGAQPVPERPPEVATRGRSVLMIAAVALAAAVLIAAILWLLVPFAG
jgi:hypothetical protein